MGALWQDIRYGLRMLLRQPGLTLIAILTLALGIGANTAIFSVVNGVLIQPLPYQDPDRLVRLSEWSPRIPGLSISYPDLLDWREQNQVFTQIAGTQFNSYNLTGGDEPERLQGRAVSAEFLEVLGVRPMLGRAFLAAEDRPGGNRVCLMSYGLWQRRFGSDPHIVGKTITLNGEPYTAVGVLPRNYRFGTPTDIFVPLGLEGKSEVMKERANHPGIYAIARLKPGVSFEQAEAEMKVIAKRLGEQYPKSNGDNSVTLTPLREYFVGEIRLSLLILLGAVSCVLLIACANVANLLLARAAARGREIAIRTALGASRLRVIRQLLTESVLLAILGGAAGLLLALWGVDILRRADLDSLPTTADIGLDQYVLGFTSAVSLLTGLIFGLAPALQASRLDLNESLKESGRSATGGRGRARVRHLLVISEVALSLVLLVGAGLLVRSFIRLRQTDTGFDPQNLVTMQLSLRVGQDEGHKVTQFFTEVGHRVKALPGVRAVAFSNGVPFLGAMETSFAIVGRDNPDVSKRPLAVEYITSPDYLQTVGVRLVKGRFFSERDTQHSPLVAVIDEEFARSHFPNEDPVGKYLEGSKEFKIPDAQIVGVVSHVKNYGLGAPGPVQAELYYSFNQVPDRFLPVLSDRMSLIVRTAADPMSLIPAVRREVQAVEKNQPVYHVKTMEQVIAESIGSQRFSMLLLSLFAVMALLLAAVGIYGVISYSVTQRTHEIGIRMALGAQTGDVLKLVLRQGITVALVGVAIGLVAALALTRLMSSLLFGVSATDPVTFALIALLLTGVALLASYLPARRATKVDPMVALRYE